MSTIYLRSPFADFDALVRQAFGPVQTRRTVVGARPNGFTPAADVTRDGDDAVVRVELPGLDVDKDVNVEIVGRRLVVRGERRDERTEETQGRSVREVRYGSFRRSFGLPSHVTSDAITATYDAGVLNVRVAGAYAGSEPQRIAVTAAPATAESGEQPAA